MPTQLRIGNVAALLGISTKTIRYYHRVALLAEPARAANGYRLYKAHDLVQLQRIRRLQALGLSLKQIRTVLGAPNGAHRLHAVLHTLLHEVERQIAVLQERRARIAAALAADADALAGESPTFAALHAQLAPYLTDEHTALLAQEQRLWALLDTAQPPDQTHALGTTLAAQLAADPAHTRALLEWSERIAALSAAGPDDPAIEQLAHAFVCSDAFRAMNAVLAAHVQAAPADPAHATFAALALDMLTPAQQRFLEMVQHLAAAAPEEVADAATHV